MNPELQTTLIAGLDGIVLLRVAGDLDMVTHRQFDVALGQAVAMARHRVEVDLSEVTFFGSEGARSLSRAWKKGRTQMIDLSVVAASRMTRHVLQIVDLRSLLAG